jgi:hypothetical protein
MPALRSTSSDVASPDVLPIENLLDLVRLLLDRPGAAAGVFLVTIFIGVSDDPPG